MKRKNESKEKRTRKKKRKKERKEGKLVGNKRKKNNNTLARCHIRRVLRGAEEDSEQQTIQTFLHLNEKKKRVQTR